MFWPKSITLALSSWNRSAALRLCCRCRSHSGAHRPMTRTWTFSIAARSCAPPYTQQDGYYDQDRMDLDAIGIAVGPALHGELGIEALSRRPKPASSGARSRPLRLPMPPNGLLMKPHAPGSLASSVSSTLLDREPNCREHLAQWVFRKSGQHPWSVHDRVHLFSVATPTIPALSP
jgi:hypothetical protein